MVCPDAGVDAAEKLLVINRPAVAPAVMSTKLAQCVRTTGPWQCIVMGPALEMGPGKRLSILPGGGLAPYKDQVQET